MTRTINAVVNMHMVAVPIDNGLAFEYRVADGACDVDGYGIALARMVGFPLAVLEGAIANLAINDGAQELPSSKAAVELAPRYVFVAEVDPPPLHHESPIEAP